MQNICAIEALQPTTNDFFFFHLVLQLVRTFPLFLWPRVTTSSLANHILDISVLSNHILVKCSAHLLHPGVYISPRASRRPKTVTAMYKTVTAM